jgi:molybdenum cofactor cytidylyltransferase
VVLAAGRSQRMGAANKLLLEVAGRPMVARAVAAARASGAAETVVVTGHMAAEVEAALAGAAVRFVRNPHYAEGLSTSLAAGIGALGADIDAAVVLLGDMPQIAAGHIDALIAAFDPAGTGAICVATFQGKRGNPVLWARRFFGELTGLKGDVGARHLIGEHAELVAEVALDGAVHTDVDTPEAYAALAGPIGG